jgi:hypothetical protein
MGISYYTYVGPYIVSDEYPEKSVKVKVRKCPDHDFTVSSNQAFCTHCGKKIETEDKTESFYDSESVEKCKLISWGEIDGKSIFLPNVKNIGQNIDNSYDEKALEISAGEIPESIEKMQKYLEKLKKHLPENTNACVKFGVVCYAN